VIGWRTGDVFCLPGGRGNVHRAVEDTVLFHCTDEPALCYLRTSAPGSPAVTATLFSGEAIDTALASIPQDRKPHRGPGRAVNLYTKATADEHSMLPLLNVAINSLQPGGRQQPHRHNPIAVTLAVKCDHVYSIIGQERIDWQPYTAVVTPPGEPHTHCNDGAHDMRAFVVQDGGMHYYCRTGGFKLLEYDALT
jgi:gentisate 1,2-dioxygenase